VGVTLAIFPLLVVQFGTVSTASPLVNAALGPVTPFFMLLAALTAVVGSVSPGAAALPAAFLWIVLHGVEAIVHAGAAIATRTPPIPLPRSFVALFWYAGLAFVLLAVDLVASTLRRSAAVQHGRRHTIRHRAPRRHGRLPALPLILGVAALGTVTVVGSSFRSAALATPARSSATWLEVSGRPAILVSGSNGVRVLVTDNRAGPLIAQAIEDAHPPQRAVDVVVFVRAASDVAALSAQRAVARDTFASALIVPSPVFAVSDPDVDGSSANARASDEDARLIVVNGRADVPLGSADALALLSDGAGGLLTVLTLGDHRVVLNGGPAMARTLESWRLPADVDAVSLPPVSPSASREALIAMKPPLLLLAGHWRADQAEVTALVAGTARVVNGGQVHDLRLELRRNELVVTYSSR
jgi:hypothetical protein